jgi:ABC-2 type transport system permease protein
VSSVIVYIIKKELIQTFRDPRMFAMLLLAPILQVILFGYAVNLDLSAQPTVIADSDRTPISREVVETLARNESFKIVGRFDSHDQAESAIERGNASLAILIPRGFEQKLEQNGAELLVVLDGADSNTALRASQETSQILNNNAITRQKERLKAALAAQGVSADALVPQLQIETRAWYNPQMKTAVFLVPGVLALVLLVVTMILTAMGLTREKETGTLEQVMVTPIKSFELMIGKIIPFALLGLVEVAVVVAVAAQVFDLPVRGSLLSLYAVTGLYLLTTLGLGLFISTVSATQQQAMLNSFFFLLPALMLSGFIFPIENMPEPVQWATYLNPLRYYIQLVRGIMIKGSLLQELAGAVAALASLGVIVLGAAALRFRKRIR